MAHLVAEGGDKIEAVVACCRLGSVCGHFHVSPHGMKILCSPSSSQNPTLANPPCLLGMRRYAWSPELPEARRRLFFSNIRARVAGPVVRASLGVSIILPRSESGFSFRRTGYARPVASCSCSMPPGPSSIGTRICSFSTQTALLSTSERLNCVGGAILDAVQVSFLGCIHPTWHYMRGANRFRPRHFI